jgi:hypothetical protein
VNLPRAFWAALLTLIMVNVAFRLFLVGGAQPVLSPDSGSYLNYAREWRETGNLPPVGQRPPAYPLLINLTVQGEDYRLTVLVQQILGIFSNLMLYALVYHLTSRVSWAMFGGLIGLLLVDLPLMEITLYAETLTLFFVMGGALALAYAIRAQHAAPLQTSFLKISGLCWAGAAFSRPAFLAAVGVFAAALVWLVSRRRVGLGTALVTGLLPLVLTGGYMVFNAARDGDGLRFATGRGYSLLNYVGYPEMYHNLPTEMAELQQIYLDAEARDGLRYVWWYAVIEAVAERYRTSENESPDDVAAEVALDVIRARPGIYAQIWLATFGRYLFSYDLQHGLLINNQRPPTPDNLQLSLAAYNAARASERFWALAIPLLNAAALILPVWMVLRRKTTSREIVLILWAIVVAVLLGSVSIEPFTRQARYRIPVQLIYVALAVSGVHSIWDHFRARRGRYNELSPFRK